MFAGGLGVELAMGWVQQMRGIHFLTRTFVTAWPSMALLALMLNVFWRPLHAAVDARNARVAPVPFRLLTRFGI